MRTIITQDEIYEVFTIMYILHYIYIICSSPLGRGFLTGTIKSPNDLAEDDWRKTSPRFFPENFTKNLNLVKEIDALAKKKNTSSPELILAWVLAQGKEFITIPGTKKVKYLEQNVKSGQQEAQLSKDELEEMRRIVNAAEISGARQNTRGVTSSTVKGSKINR